MAEGIGALAVGCTYRQSSFEYIWRLERFFAVLVRGQLGVSCDLLHLESSENGDWEDRGSFQILRTSFTIRTIWNRTARFAWSSPAIDAGKEVSILESRSCIRLIPPFLMIAV